MATEQFCNRGESRLGGAVSIGATTFTVVDVSSFPTKPQFHIVVDFEIMLVTAVNSNVFTVSRGREGTTPAIHQADANVIAILTKETLENFRLDTNKLISGIPDSTDHVAGRVNYISNGYSLWYDDGANFKRFGPLFPLNYISASAFTVLGDGTISETNEGPLLASNPNFSQTSIYMVLAKKTVLTVNFSITASFLFLPSAFNDAWDMGLAVREISSNDIFAFGLKSTNTLILRKGPSLTQFSVNTDLVNIANLMGQRLFLNITRVSNTLLLKYGFDPKVMLLARSILIPDTSFNNFIPDEVGFYIISTGNGDNKLRLLHWLEV